MKRSLLGMACAAVLAAGPSAAHDSWFEPLRGGEGLLALGTGNEFPQRESAIDAQYLQRQGCRSDAGAAVALKSLRTTDSALLLQPARRGAPLTCWAQLTPFEVELAPDKIELYLREINASAATRSAWAAMHARGLPWKERYTKHARIELGGASARPLDLGMDIVIDSGPVVAGQAMSFQVLRDGRPLADFAVELRSAQVRFGLWLRTDAEGRASTRVPLPGRWLLRGVDLRVSGERPDTWDSRFVTLAFEAAAQAGTRGAMRRPDEIGAPGDGRYGSSFRSNTRSASHTAATAATSAEPSPNTTLR